MGLLYTGGGSLPGVPARDLSPEEVEKYGGETKLLETGLYAKPAKNMIKRDQSQKEGE